MDGLCKLLVILNRATCPFLFFVGSFVNATPLVFDVWSERSSLAWLDVNLVRRREYHSSG